MPWPVRQQTSTVGALKSGGKDSLVGRSILLRTSMRFGQDGEVRTLRIEEDEAT